MTRSGSGPNVIIDEGMSTSRFLTGIGHHSMNLAAALDRHLPCRLTNYGLIRYAPRIFRRFLYTVTVNCVTPVRRADVVHFQNYYVPRFRGTKTVVATIQDLTAFILPDILAPFYRWYARKAIVQAIERADLIIVPLKAIRKELHEIFPESREKPVEVCPDGLREIFFSGRDGTGVLPPGLTPGRFFLAVGTIERRKNLPVLVKAFLEWRTKPGIAEDFKLALVGQDGSGSEEVDGLIRQSGAVVRIRGLGDRDLPALYRSCRAMIFPSLYEGFGLPLVEAMSQGAPIVASDIPTTRELNGAHGNHFRLFNPDRGDELVECMDAVHRENVTGPVLYGDLSVYSYDSIARVHAGIYRTLLAG